MVIRYNIGLDDHKAYHGTIRSAVSGFLAIRCMQSLGGPAFLLFLLWACTQPSYGWWPTLAGTVPAALLGTVLWRTSPGLWRRANLDAMHAAGKLNGHLGEHSLELRDEGLLERNEAGEHLSRWDQIENIVSRGNRTFFVTKTQLAYVLPESSIIEGDYEAFVAAAVTKWNKKRG